jgi:hypothetical protein
VGGGGAHILGSPMLFVPFTVPSFSTAHQQQASHQLSVSQAHQTLQSTPCAQNRVVQQQPVSQLNHLNHQSIVHPPSNQTTIHSNSCSPPQQLSTTPNKVSLCQIVVYIQVLKDYNTFACTIYNEIKGI